MTKKVFDVRRPGKAPASPTSRPVITGHKPPVADDQFVPPAVKPVDDSGERALMDAHQKVTLTPLHEDEAVTPPNPAATTIQAEPAPTPPQAQEPVPTPEQMAVEQVVETPAEPPAAINPTPSTDPLLAPIEEDETLLDNTGAPVVGQAVISHHKKHHTKAWEWVLIILLMLLLAVVALNFLLDAEIIQPGFDIPHTNVLQ